MRIYTIGFTKKSAEQFFEILRKNNVTQLLDIRLNNVSQLAGFAKGNDLRYFVRNILGIGYKHDTRFAPSKELLDGYKDNTINWDEYEDMFMKIINERNLKNIIENEYLKQIDGICILCSELEAKHCHRRLVAELIKEVVPDIEINHL